MKNGSDFSFDGGGKMKQDSTTWVLIGIILSMVIILSVAGNCLVCIAIFTERSLRKIGNLFIISLATADLFVGVLVMTFALCNDIMGYWAFGEQFCDMWVACDVLCTTASILNLSAISFDRYIYIKDPLRYGRWMTRKKVLLTILGIWSISSLVSFLPISLGLHKSHSVHPSPLSPLHCTLDLTPTFAIVSSLVSFYLPCIVMVAMYSKLYKYAQKHVNMIKAITKPMMLGSVNGKELAPPIKYPVSEHKAAVTVGVVMGVFLFCYVPFFTINIIAAFCKECIPSPAFKILTWMGYFNSSLNPIIYSIFNLEFREAFKKILSGKFGRYCCRCQEPNVLNHYLDDIPRVKDRRAMTDPMSPSYEDHFMRSTLTLPSISQNC